MDYESAVRVYEYKSLFRKTKSSWKLMYDLNRYNTLVTNTYNISAGTMISRPCVYSIVRVIL